MAVDRALADDAVVDIQRVDRLRAREYAPRLRAELAQEAKLDRRQCECLAVHFFDEATNNLVLANYPHNTRGARDTTNQNDGIYDASMLLDLATNNDGSYTGTIMLGLELEGTTLGDAIFSNGFEPA